MSEHEDKKDLTAPPQESPTPAQGDPFALVEIRHVPAPAAPWHKYNRHAPKRTIWSIGAAGNYGALDLATIWGEQCTDSAESIADAICLAVNSHAALLAAVTKSQALLARWIVPDSDLDDQAVLSALLGILDNKDLVELVRGAK